MSAPVYDDGDKRTMYAPPWARDPQRDDVEARRLQTEIIAAAERLKPPEPPQPVQRPASPQDKDFQTRFLGERPGKQKAGPADQFEDEIRAVWQPSLLDPVPMPPPPKPEVGGPTWGMVSRLAGAAGFAAIVALFVAGAIPLPSIEFSLSRDPADANAAAPPVAAGYGNANPQVPLAQQAPAAVAAAPQPAPPATQTVALAPIAPPLPPAPPRQKTEAEAALPEARVLDYMSAEEIEGLLKRGQDLIATGDISGGRLLLTRAAEAGEPRAALALAATYDSAVIAGLGVVGAFPDTVKARAWYAKAASQGNAEAARRLEQPHLRQR